MSIASRRLLFFLLVSLVTFSAFADSDIGVEKFGPSEAAAGANVAYTITIFNGGPDASGPVTVSDPIPGTMTFFSVSQESGPTFICSTPAQGDPGSVDCTAADMAPGDTAVLTFTFTIPAQTPPGTSFTNTATVSTALDPNEENNASTITTTVPTVMTDVGVQKTAPGRAGPDTDLTYTIDVTNSGPDAATTVTLTDDIPGTATFVSLDQTGEALSCTTPAVGAGGTITCTANGYPAGALTTLTLVVHIPPGTSGSELTNTASVVASDDTNEENDSSTVSTLISAADVQIVKNGPPTAFAGSNISYTIVASNSGDTAVGLLLQDTLPAGTTFVSFNQDLGVPFACVKPSVGGTGTIQCTADFMGNGASATFTLVVAVDASVSSVQNTATIVANDSFDPDTSNNTSSTTASITPAADLVVTKSGPATVTAGNNVTYTITIVNNGPSPAASVSLTDTLPAGATYVSFAQTSGPSFNCSGTATITCTIDPLAAGATATFQLVAHVDPAASGTLDNTAQASSSTTDLTPGDASSQTSAAINTSADLSIAKNGPATIDAGTDITWTLTATNNGPSDAQNVSLSDTLPAGTTFVSLTQNSGPAFTCSGGATSSCSIGTLAAGATATFTLVAHVDASANGTISNTATISTTTTDPNSGNDSSTSNATVTQSADLAVTKTSAASVTAGTNLTYSIGVMNNGPSDASNVTLSDTLPAGTSFVSLTQNTGPSFNCTTGATITCTIAAFPNGSSATFDLVVAVASSQTADLSNTASVSANSADTVPSNDSATANTVVNEVADLSVTKVGPVSATSGTDISYNISLTNSGPSDAASVTLSDTLPAQTTFVSLTQDSGPAFNCSGTTCTIASLANGATATFTLVAHVASGATGTIDNTATVSSPADTTPGNNASTASTPLAQSADVTIAKTAAASVTAGTDLTYTIAIGNSGPSDATSVAWTDTLPAGTTFVSLTQTSGPSFNCTTGATINCSIATLTSGANASFDVVAHVAASATGSISNTVNATSVTPDPSGENNSSTANVTVTISADVAVTKSAPSSSTAGTNATYTITVTNNGPSDAASVSLTDTVPVSTTFVSFTQTSGPSFNCTTGATTTCTIATLASGATATFDLTVAISPSATGTISNTATVSSTTADPTPANNTATSSVTANSNANLSIAKSGPANGTAGMDVTFTINVANAGPSEAANVVITDTLPAGTTFVSINQTTGPTFNCTTGATVTCTIGTFANGATASFDLVAHIASSATGTIANTATIASDALDPTPANNTSTATVAVVTSADVSIAKSAPATVTAGANATYTITVANAGPSDALSVTFTDALPSGTSFVSVTQTAGPTFNCTTGATVSCSIASLVNGSSATFDLVVLVSPSATGTISNTANVTTSTTDPNGANDTATANSAVTTSADLAVVKSGPGGATAGATLTYTLSATNAGPSDATNVTITDTLPAGTTFVSLNQTSGPTFTCTTGPVVSCTIATFASGATAAFSLTLNVSPAATGTLANTATIAAATADPNAGNNTSTTNTAIGLTADLAVTKSGDASVAAGDNITYTITATNNGPSDATSVTLTDTVPATSTFVSFTQNSGPSFNCTTGMTITCTIGTLVPGASATFTLVTTSSPAAFGSLDNVATINSSTPDPNAANNTATATTVLNPGPTDLRISKTANGTNFTAGGTAVFTIVVTNDGPGLAADVIVNDPLPNGMTLVSSSATQGSCSGTTNVTCTVGTLAAGGSATITLNVQLSSLYSGNSTNTATVSALNAEIQPSNNLGSVSFAILPVPVVPTLSPLMLAAFAAMIALLALKVIRS